MDRRGNIEGTLCQKLLPEEASGNGIGTGPLRARRGLHLELC